MKHVTIFGPTIVRAGAAQTICHPHENPVLVSNKEAERLKVAGVLEGEPVDAEGDDPVEPDPGPKPEQPED